MKIEEERFESIRSWGSDCPDEDKAHYQLFSGKKRRYTKQLVAAAMSEIVPEPVQWLWEGHIPLGKLTILDGDPGTGKSTLSLDLAARISTGAVMPDGTAGHEGAVILLSAEDSAFDTTVPRLKAAGADLTRVFDVASVCDRDNQEPINLADDVELLGEFIEETKAVLVVIDPFLAYVSSKYDSYVDRDVREVLANIANVAEHTGAAFLLIRHRRKSLTGDPLRDGMGSIGIIAACRSGLLLAPDPVSSERRILAVSKQNLVKTPTSLAFHFVETPLGAPKLAWDGPSTYTATDLSNPYYASGNTESALQEAREFLEEILVDGPVPTKEVFEQATALGISDITLQRAKKEVAKSKKSGLQGGWSWQLKETPPQP